MVFKLAKSAERHWRRPDGSERLAQVIEGVHFRDGEPVQETEDQAAANAKNAEAEPAQLLEHPHQRQTLAGRPGSIRRQDPLQIRLPRADFR